MGIIRNLFHKVNIGSTHPHDLNAIIIVSNLNSEQSCLRFSGKMEEGYTPKTILPIAYLDILYKLLEIFYDKKKILFCITSDFIIQHAGKI